MKKNLLLLLLNLWTLPVLAQSIQVEYGFNIYSLAITEQEITYKKKDFTAVVKKEKCSTKLFNDYASKFKEMKKDLPKDQTSGAEFLVKYKIDDKEGILTPSHPLAQKLLSIPNSFDVFKLATEFRCEKDKK